MDFQNKLKEKSSFAEDATINDSEDVENTMTNQLEQDASKVIQIVHKAIILKMKYNRALREVGTRTDKFGELVKNLNFYFMGEMTIQVFLLFSFTRRALMAYIIVHIPHLWAQLMLCMYINQAYMMFVVYFRLFYDKKEWIIQCLNEIIVLLTIYHLFAFTDWVTDPWMKTYFIGYSMVGMTGLNMLVNLVPLLPELFKHAVLRFKRSVTRTKRLIHQVRTRKTRKSLRKRKRQLKALEANLKQVRVEMR